MALVPVGVVVGLIIAFVLAAILAVELFPSDPSDYPTFTENALVWGAASLVWVAVPTVAIVLGIRAVRGRAPHAVAAVVVAAVLLVAMLALSASSLTCCWS